MRLKARRFLEFGPFRLDTDSRLLLRQGEVIPLPPKAFEVLETLVSSDGRVLTRDELMTAVWGDVAVEDGNLSQAISILRKALSDNAQEPQYIVTIPRRGYRFGTDVQEVRDIEAPAEPDTNLDGPIVTPDSPPSFRPLHRWLLAAGLAAATILAAAGYWFAVRPSRAAAIQSVAVLPFVNLSPIPEQEYLSDGLTEEIINALALIPGLKVAARTSAFQFKGKNVDIRSIGAKLGVDAVLEGSVRTEGARLRITAQLNNTRDGYHHWSRTWERTVGDVFAIQEEIAGEVVKALGQPNGPLFPRVKPLTLNWEAHDFYLKGLHLKSHLLEGTLPKTVASFERALELDPRFASAHAQVGQAYIWALQDGTVPAATALPEAKRRAQKALALDPDLALAHALEADVRFFGEWDFPAAERSFRRAIELNPADTGTHHEFSHFLLAMRRFDEAEVEARLNLELDPLGIDTLNHLQLHFLTVRDIPRALSAAERALALDPRSSVVLLFLQWTHESAKQYQKAIETAEKRAEVERAVIASLRESFQKHGEVGYWRAWHQSTLKKPMDEASRAWGSASFYARMGQRERALRELRQAIELRYTNAVYLNVASQFEGLRGDPEFRKIGRRIGLPER